MADELRPLDQQQAYARMKKDVETDIRTSRQTGHYWVRFKDLHRPCARN